MVGALAVVKQRPASRLIVCWRLQFVIVAQIAGRPSPRALWDLVFCRVEGGLSITGPAVMVFVRVGCSARCPGGVRAVSGWVPVTRSGSRWGPGLLFAGLRHGLGCDGLPGGVGQGTGGQGGRVAALECGRARRHRGSHVVEPGLRVGPWGSADSVGGLLAGPAAVAAAGAGGQRRAACVTPARVVVAGAPCVASRLSSRMWW